MKNVKLKLEVDLTTVVEVLEIKGEFVRLRSEGTDVWLRVGDQLNVDLHVDGDTT